MILNLLAVSVICVIFFAWGYMVAVNRVATASISRLQQMKYDPAADDVLDYMDDLEEALIPKVVRRHLEKASNNLDNH